MSASGPGANCPPTFMYPADGGALAAVIAAPDLDPTGCIGGSPDFALPGSCLYTGASLTLGFNGPGALPGCSTFDAGQAAAVDGGPDATLDAADGAD